MLHNFNRSSAKIKLNLYYEDMKHNSHQVLIIDRYTFCEPEKNLKKR